MAFVTLRQARQLDRSGWTRVNLLNPRLPYEPANQWIRNHTQGRCHNDGHHLWFEHTEDAVVFALKWVK